MQIEITRKINGEVERVDTLEGYTAEELREAHPAAFERAHSRWAETALDYEWWDSCYDLAIEIGAMIGIEIAPRDLQFSGFWSQGDGASFAGRYGYARGGAARVRRELPADEEIHRIAEELRVIQARNFYQLSATVALQGRYCHSGSMSVDVYRDDDREPTPDAEGEIRDCLRAFADWLYLMLEREWEYLTSESAFIESADGDLFDDSGRRV